MFVSTRSSKRAAALKETARLSTRPSTSGSETFMPRSRAVSPCPEASQASRDDPEKTICKTGAPVSSSTVGLRPAPGAETAKLVAFSVTCGWICAKAARTVSIDAGSLRLETKSGNARMPSAASASISISTGRVSPLWT